MSASSSQTAGLASLLTLRQTAPIWTAFANSDTPSTGTPVLAVSQLRGLATQIIASIEDVRLAAAAARAAVSELLPPTDADSAMGPEEIAIDRGALAVAIDAAEAEKLSALDAEAVAVDAGLEALLDLCSCIDEAVATGIDDPGAMDLHGRFNALLSDLRLLPSGPVEPTAIFVLSSGPSPAGRVMSTRLGRVCAPRAPNASEIRLVGLPGYARPGHAAECRLEAVTYIGEDVLPEESASAVAILLQHVTASASLGGPASGEAGADAQRLSMNVKPDPSRPGVVIMSVMIPADTPRGTRVSLRGVRLAGRPVAGAEAFSTVAWVVQPGLIAPQDIALGRDSPKERTDRVSVCISPDGSLYILGYGFPAVEHFAFDGSALPSIDLARLGFSSRANALGIVNQSSIVIAEHNGDGSVLALVDVGTQSTRWTAKGFRSCCSLAVLPIQGIVATQSFFDGAFG